MCLLIRFCVCLCYFVYTYNLCLGQEIMILLPPKDGPLPCDTPQFSNLQKCCPTPQFFPRDSVIWCIEEMRTIDPKENLTDFQEFASSSQPLDFYSGILGPMIMIECVFKNHSLLARSGLINLEKTMNHLVGISESAWRSVVQTVVETCILDISRLNVTTIPDSSFANIAPAYFMSCVRRGLTLNCPKTVRDLSVDCPTAGCNETFIATLSCDPFSLEVGKEGGPRGWLGTLLKWMAGPKISIKPPTKQYKLPLI